MKFVHINLIAKDYKKMVDFYKTVFDCESIDEKRDIKGAWLDKVTAVKNAHIKGEHLKLPGYKDNYPTIEIFSYEEIVDSSSQPNKKGFSHIAFEVEDINKTIEKLTQNGGKLLGEVVETEYKNDKKAYFAYTLDIEDNIIELQSFSQ